MKTSLPIKLFVSLVVLIAVSAVCNAQSNRTWVSGVGSDANPCSRTAPCLTFTGAIAKTNAGGEIDTLDPGDFGSVTITKPISIVGNGLTAGILTTAGDAITINAGFNDVIIIKNLTIDGAGQGGSGIRFNTGAALQVENCVINNFTANGIDFAPVSASAVLTVKDSTIRNNAGTGPGGMGGIYLHPTTIGARATLNGVNLNHNRIGLRADDNSFVSMKNTDVVANNMTGVAAMSTSLASTIDIEDSSIVQGLADGITSRGGFSVVTISNVAINKNSGFGLRQSNGGTIISFANNKVIGNSIDGTPSYTVTQK